MRYPRSIWHAELLALDLSRDDDKTVSVKLGVWIDAANYEADATEVRKAFAEGFYFGLQRAGQFRAVAVREAEARSREPIPPMLTVPPSKIVSHTVVGKPAAKYEPLSTMVVRPVMKNEPIAAPRGRVGAAIRIEPAGVRVGVESIATLPILPVKPSLESGIPTGVQTAIRDMKTQR